jgi:hypothetical protein
MPMATKSVKPRVAAKPRTRPASPAGWTLEQRQQIAERAYELFQERGGQHGYHQEDWLRAEAEFGASTNGAKKPRKAKTTAA